MLVLKYNTIPKKCIFSLVKPVFINRQLFKTLGMQLLVEFNRQTSA